MDTRLTPEQQALRDAAARMVDQLGPTTVAGLDDIERRVKLDAALAASGWRQLRDPDEPGVGPTTTALGNVPSPVASGVEAAIVAEELGRGLADAAFIGPALAADLRRLAGAPWSSESETVAFGADLEGQAIVADGGSGVGDAVAVDAEGAARALALVPVDDAFLLVTLGVGQATGRTDLTRLVAPLTSGPPAAVADQVRPVTADALVRWRALGLALTCADLVGAMRGALDLSVGYVGERSQYGRPVGSFQAVQHLLADAAALTEGSSSISRHAAWAVDVLAPGDALVAAAAAKVYSVRAARTVCETAIQVHGGIGNTWECLAHVFLRRTLLAGDLFGGIGSNLALVLASRGIGNGGSRGDHGLR